MKLSKILLAAGAAVLATSSAFAADVTIRMTGSTAFRASTMAAIMRYFIVSGSPVADLKIVASNPSLNSANQATFRGTRAGKVVLIQCSWSGSLDGVRDVADTTNPTVTNFLTEASLASDTTAGDLTHTVVGATTGNVESAVPDIAMADSTQFETGYTGGKYATLVETPVGVIPFVIVKGKSNNAAVQTALNRVTNITSLQIQGMLAGFYPLSALTGNAADNSIYANVVGRDFGSGTRLSTFVESGFGRGTDPLQYTYTVTAGEITALTENAAPSAGYTSGSSLRTAAGTPTAAAITDAAVFTYMGTSDAAGISGMTFDNVTGTFGGTAAAQVLPFNGVPYSHDAVRNGTYSYWNYEVLMHRASLIGDKLTVVEAIKQDIINADAAVGGIKLSTMTVNRASSGKVIQPL